MKEKSKGNSTSLLLIQTLKAEWSWIFYDFIYSSVPCPFHSLILEN